MVSLLSLLLQVIITFAWGVITKVDSTVAGFIFRLKLKITGSQAGKLVSPSTGVVERIVGEIFDMILGSLKEKNVWLITT